MFRDCAGSCYVQKQIVGNKFKLSFFLNANYSSFLKGGLISIVKLFYIQIDPILYKLLHASILSFLNREKIGQTKIFVKAS